VVTPQRVFPVEVGAGAFTIGRSREATLQVDDPTVAPLHLSLRARDQGLELEALGGQAAKLNEVQLSGPSLARAGDQVEIGETSLVVVRLSRQPPRPLRVLSAETFDTLLEVELGRTRRQGRPLALWLLDSPAAEPHAREALWKTLGPLLPAAVLGELGPRTLQLLLPDLTAADSHALLGRASTLLGRAGIRFAFGAASAPQDADEPDRLRERALTELEDESFPDEDPIQIDPVMGRLFGLAERLGQGGAPVHLLGEPGVGKETLARAIHLRGACAVGAFVRVDCAGPLEGTLERAVADASGGTLFLRGVERWAPGRALPEVPQGQLITSSRTTLEKGALSVLHLPPLRERPTEIPALAETFLARYARTLGRERRVLSPTARRVVAEAAWDGNVRALRIAMAHAVLATRGPEVQPEALPPSLHQLSRGGPARNDLRGALKAAEREALLSALAATAWNVTRAAELLSLPRRTVVYRMSRLGLRRPGR
jgi:hypothetical protein